MSQGYSTEVANQVVAIDIATRYYTNRSLRSPATTVEACCPLTRDQIRIVVNESTGTTATTLGDDSGGVINLDDGVSTLFPSGVPFTPGLIATCAAVPNSDFHGGNNIAARVA
jgi:hypothetical protein